MYGRRFLKAASTWWNRGRWGAACGSNTLHGESWLSVGAPAAPINLLWRRFFGWSLCFKRIDEGINASKKFPLEEEVSGQKLGRVSPGGRAGWGRQPARSIWSPCSLFQAACAYLSSGLNQINNLQSILKDLKWLLHLQRKFFIAKAFDGKSLSHDLERPRRQLLFLEALDLDIWTHVASSCHLLMS